MILLYAIIVLVCVVVGFVIVLAIELRSHDERDATRDEYERWLL